MAPDDMIPYHVTSIDFYNDCIIGINLSFWLMYNSTFKPQDPLQRHGQFHFFLKFSRGGGGREGGARKFEEKIEIDHFFTPGPLRSPCHSLHVRHIYMSKIYTVYIQHTYPGSLLSWIPIVLDPYCSGFILSWIPIVLHPYCLEFLFS